MQGAGEMVGGERESMCACETKRGAEGEVGGGGGACVCCVVLCCVVCVCVCVFSRVIILIA